MEILLVILLVLVVGALNVACFLFGARVGQKVVKGEAIELPKIDPMKAIREHEDRKEAQRESERMAAIMRNIDSYDGSGNGQEDIPRG
jgi:hypothetical protein